MLLYYNTQFKFTFQEPALCGYLAFSQVLYTFEILSKARRKADNYFYYENWIFNTIFELIGGYSDHTLYWIYGELFTPAKEPDDVVLFFIAWYSV